MNPKNRFKLTRQAMLLATISAAFPVVGYCSAGRVDFAIGNVESVATNGSRHSLSKGAEINAGETISTAAGARAQVRFADGGFVSLQPNTQFRVDEFNYKNKTDGEEKGFFSLLKGGFRAITGAIGHANKQTYRVKTPAATLGIRGTGYNMVLRDDGLFVNVGEGAISLSNNAGLLVVTAGGAAFVANANTAPVPTNEQPHTPPAGLPEPTFSVADNRNSSGNTTLLSMPSGLGYAMAYAYMATTTSNTQPLFGSVLLTGVDATISGSSQLAQYTGPQEGGTLGSASVPFSKTDGIIGWGRWVGNIAGTGTGPNPMTGATFDYIVGIPTAAMPTSGSANYSLMDYTSTATNASSGYTVSGTLAVTFAATSSVAVNMTVANSTANSITSNGSVLATAPGAATFSGSMTGGAVTGTGCTSSCTTTINGFFAGTNASRAGLSYSISVNNGNYNIQGVAAFAKN